MDNCCCCCCCWCNNNACWRGCSNPDVTGFAAFKRMLEESKELCGEVERPSCAEANADMEVFSKGEQGCGVNIEDAGDTLEMLEMFEIFRTFVSSLVGVPGGEISCTVPFTESGVKWYDLKGYPNISAQFYAIK